MTPLVLIADIERAVMKVTAVVDKIKSIDCAEKEKQE